MPKVFLTGSGATRGYLTGSGFVSNPPRYLIRQFDSATGSYPTIARTGDASRLGNYNVSFDDTNTIYFEDPYATAEINFDMVFQTKIVPIETPGIYYGPVNSNILGEGYKEVIEPTIKETFLSPLDGDTITLTDADGSSVVFTFKYGLNLSGLSNNEVQIPINRYDRKLLAKNFTEKINKHPGIKIQATLLDEPRKFRLPGRNNAGKSESFANGTIKLRQQKPGTVGNKAITKSLTAPSIFGSIEGISTTDFSGGIDISRVVYPQLLSADITPMKIQVQGTATPNFSSENLDNSGGVIRKGISDAHIRFTEGEDLTVFNDSRIDIRGDRYYEVGTPDEIYPGFSSKLADKTQIHIELPNNREEYLVRNVKKRSDVLDPDGFFFGQDKTGFVYYNFDTGRWDQIGLIDAATQTEVEYDWALETDRSVSPVLIRSGTNHFPQQFYAPRQLGGVNASTKGGRTNFAYQSVGLPIINNFAPHGNMYHATSSQCLKLNNYINSPFLLEKITVEVPYIARRTSKGTTTPNTPETWLDKQEMINLTFFAYKQTNNTPPGSDIDTLYDVTGSTRNLIFSGAMCFYNRSYTAGGTTYTTFEPEHTPAFKYDFNQTPKTNYTVTVTGSATLELQPEIANSQVIGFGFIPSSSVWPSNASLSNPSYTAFWPGGNTFKEYGETIFSGKPGSIRAYSGSNTDFMSIDMTDGVNLSSVKFKTAFNNLYSTKVFDSKNFISLTGGEIKRLRTNNDVILEGQRSMPTRYLLLPEDKLVFGWDTGVSTTEFTKVHNELTGSYMKLRTDLPIKITLYGSQIKNGVEFHDTLNQPLTSDAIHEAIHYDNPTIDQFSLEPRDSYIGSYLDDYNSDGFKLRIKNPSERIGKAIGSIISGSAGGENASFARHIQAYDLQKIFSDTLLPDVKKIIKNNGAFSPVSEETYTIKWAHRASAVNESESLCTTGSTSIVYQKPYAIEDTDGPIAFKTTEKFLQNKHDTASIWPIDTAPRTYTGEPTANAEQFSAARQVPCPVNIANYTGTSGQKGLTANDKDFNFSVVMRTMNPDVLANNDFLYPYFENPTRVLSQDPNLVVEVSRMDTYYMLARCTFVGTGGLFPSTTAKLGIDSSNNDAGNSGSGKAYRDVAVDQVIEGTREIDRLGFAKGNEVVGLFYGGTANSLNLENFIINPDNLIGRDVGRGKAYPTMEFPFATLTFDRVVRTRPVTFPGVTGSLMSTENRTFSYGIMSTTPARNKFYFRSDRYTGQFADIISSGLDSAFSNIASKLNASIKNFRFSKNETLDPPVIIKFVSGSNVKPRNDTKGRKFKLMKPSELKVLSSRQSSNMSLFATSSLPFFDDDIARN